MEFDPYNYGVLSEKVGTLENEVRELRQDVKKMLGLIENARGGYKTMIALGGLSAAVGALIVKIATYLALIH